MTTKHTPTPWETEINFEGKTLLKTTFKRINADDLIAVMLEKSAIGESSEANAAFIARACNSHDALISALQGVVDSLSQNKTFPADVENAKRLAVNALVKAKGDA